MSYISCTFIYATIIYIVFISAWKYLLFRLLVSDRNLGLDGAGEGAGVGAGVSTEASFGCMNDKKKTF